MSATDSDQRPRPFLTTRWSMVHRAGGDKTPATRQALETLCRQYWYPLYAYVRRRGHDAQQSQDLVQGFFSDLLERGGLQAADPERGKFRTFLLSSLNNYIANQRRHDRAEKRGGGLRGWSLDLDDGERRYRLEPSDEMTPERIYERRWALMLLDEALKKLEEEYSGQDRVAQFQALRPYLAGNGPQSYAQLSAELGMSIPAIKVAIHRLRRRYRDALRNLIAETVDDLDAIDDELRHLFDVL